LPPCSRIDFTWRGQDGGEWAGSDFAVRVLDADASAPPDRADATPGRDAVRREPA
jgi:hypothetical protein